MAAVVDAFDRRRGQWARLGSHPNVVGVCARGTSPRPWLAVPAIEGRHLGAFGGSLSTAAVRSVVADAAEALHAASREGTHHGALAPPQVHVCQGSGGVDGRIDWGVERACRVAAGGAPTSPYAAPELDDDPGGATPAADAYALGAITYEAATGSPPDGPFVGDGSSESGGFRPPTALAPGLPERLDAVLSTALAVDPGDRYPTPYAFKLAVLFDAGGPADGSPPLAADPGHGAAGVGVESVADQRSETPGAADPGRDVDADGESESDAELDAGERDVTDDGGSTRRAVLGALGVAALGGGLLAVRRFGEDDGTGSESDPEPSAVEDDTVTLSPPTADFEFARDDGSLTIRHAGGDAVGAGNLVVVSNALENSRLRWSNTEAYGAGDRVVPGDSLVLEIEQPLFVELRWEHGGRTEVLDSYEDDPPVDISPPAEVQLPPNASFTVSFDDGAVTVTHETGDPIPADRLLFRGAGFAGAPETSWGDVSSQDPQSVVNPGDAVQFEAGGDVAVHLFWEFERQEGTPVEGRLQVPLAQFYGPGRPLEPAIGGVPTAQYDAANTGYERELSSQGQDAAVAWLFDARPTAWSGRFAFGSLSPSPAVSEGVVYAGSASGNCYAVDAADGVELWRTEAGVLDSPTVAENTVYLAGTALQALDARDGAERWTVETPQRFLGSPRVVDGTVYATSGEPFEWTLHAVDAPTGDELWQTDLEGGIARTPAVVDDTVVVTADDVYAFDAADGSQQWVHEVETLPGTPAAAGGTIYVSETAEDGASGVVRALDLADGTEQWRRETPGALQSSVAIANGTVYAAGGTDSGGSIVAMNTADGGTQWSRQLEEPVDSPPVVVDGVLTLAERHRLVGMNAVNGAPRWRYDADDELLGSPVVATHGLYVVGRAHTIHALGSSGT